MNWDTVIQKVGPYVVKIETPNGSGTGYLCTYSENRQLCGIATALHVVDAADDWQQPIRIHNHDFSKTIFLKEDDRFIYTNRRNDSAVILCPVGDLGLPQALIQLRPVQSPLSIGAEVGWLGYPGLDPYTLCFFSGNISARRKRSGYLIDGVAINGVSGGPVLYCDGTDGVQFVGIVSAYHANRLTGETLPGLLIAQDVSHFEQAIKSIRDLDEARKKSAEEEKDKGKNDTPPPPPSDSGPNDAQ